MAQPSIIIGIIELFLLQIELIGRCYPLQPFVYIIININVKIAVLILIKNVYKNVFLKKCKSLKNCTYNINITIIHENIYLL